MRWFKALYGLLCMLVVQAEAQNSSELLQAALTTLPDCAVSCLITLVAKSTCNLTDFYCISRDAQLNVQIESCVQANCTIRESLTTKNFTVTAYGLPARDHSPLVSYIGLIGGGITLLCVILRTFARMPCFGGTWGWDDWGILVTMIPVLPLSALSLILANDGLGKDMWTVPFDNITKILHIYYYDEMLYLSSIALTKISILLFYLRIFPNRTFRALVWVGIAYCIGYILGTILALTFQCKPLNLAWTRWDGEHAGQCFNLNLLGWMSAALNILGDVMVICLPLHELSKLAMGKKKKAGIMLMFLGGGFVTIVSMLRLKYMIQFANSHNVTWDYTPIGYWSTLEVHVGIIIACLPAVRSLQRRIFPSSRSPNSYYMEPSGGYGYNSKGGSPFPSIIKSKTGQPGATVTSQTTELRTRDRTPGDKEFIPLEEFDFRLGDKVRLADKPPANEKESLSHTASNSIDNKPGSINTDDGAVLLPIQSTRGLSPPRTAAYQNSGRINSPAPSSKGAQNSGRKNGPQYITVTKDYSVTVEITPDQLSSSPPRESEDIIMRGRRESVATMKRFSGAERKRSLSRKRVG